MPASPTPRVWIVDDDRSIRFVLERALEREGIATRSFAQAAEALAALERQQPSVLLCDIRMPGMSGLEMLEQVRARHPALKVIVMTAYAGLGNAISAFQGGAFEYLPKPFDLPRAVALIRRLCEEASPVTDKTEGARASPATSSGSTPSGSKSDEPEMLGQAPAMQDLFRAIARLSQSAVNVLITGESGSGKELVARALHRHSPRAALPFVAINTAAIPRELLESELFGHERGAFTGAQTTRQGRFEQAGGGTLFLDEIGDMPLEMQTRLLRVLSEGSYYRVGGNAPIHSAARIIAATHQNLEERIQAGTFREDLFHRLNVIRLRLPSLRERAEDIEGLAQYFLQISARELGIAPKTLSPAALARLRTYPFPGNVRQLRNVCHWLSVMAPASQISDADLPPELLDKISSTGDGNAAQDWQSLLRAQALRELSQAAQSSGDLSGPASIWENQLHRAESTLLTAALEHTQGARGEAARLLGIGRNTLARKMQELGLETDVAEAG